MHLRAEWRAAIKGQQIWRILATYALIYINICIYGANLFSA